MLAADKQRRLIPQLRPGGSGVHAGQREAGTLSGLQASSSAHLVGRYGVTAEHRPYWPPDHLAKTTSPGVGDAHALTNRVRGRCPSLSEASLATSHAPCPPPSSPLTVM